MSTIGRIMGSAITAHNENTAALASLNFDFALFKFEAPKEFHQLGSALSPWRRNAAEKGSSHRTARKLGALFEQIIVPAEALFKAYGSRVSEISASPANNPKGSRLDGVFESQVGADGTSIWAAATSGKAAMAIHLLACILARLWPKSEATAIWVELVEERKRQIREIYDGTEPSHFAPLAASEKNITRKELAEWDASARSWLEIADQAKKRQHSQMRLILENLNIPVDSSPVVYTSVVRAWKTAMNTMESLIQGMPQRVQNGAILLALSAWHIYPDMDVFASVTKKVNQNDQLVGIGGRLTVGLEDTNPNGGDGVFWSLSLAHLRFYGDPQLSLRSAGSDASRVSFEQLTLAVLGSFFNRWDGPKFDMIHSAELLVAIWDYLVEVAAEPENFSSSREKLDAQQFLVSPSTWLHCLVRAAKYLLESEKEDHDRAVMLVKLGLRRGSSFLGPKEHHPSPMFGLLDSKILIPLLRNEEAKIDVLRRIAKQRGFGARIAIIRYLSSVSNDIEYATVFPSARGSTKRSHDGEERHHETHTRWIPFINDKERSICRCSGICTKKCSCHQAGLECISRCHKAKSGKIPDDCGNPHNHLFRDSIAFFKSKGEDTFFYDKTCTKISNNGLQLSWYNPPSLLCPTVPLTTEHPSTLSTTAPQAPDETVAVNASATSADFNRSSKPEEPIGESFVEWEEAILELDKWSDQRTTTYACTLGDEGSMAIFVSSPEKKEDDISARTSSVLATQEIIGIVRSGVVDANKIMRHLNKIWSPSGLDSFIRSLKAFASAAMIYKLLPGAAVALRIIGQTLATSHWIPSDDHVENEQTTSLSRALCPFTLDRARTFACVAMFETGTLDISPDGLMSVMAMSSGNSIYVAAPLLCDPAENPDQYELRRLIGNIGHSGITMLIPPENPRLRKLGYNTWHLVNHAAFDGLSQDSFENTSMHLSFTGYEQPVVGAVSHGAQDHEASFIESLISVHDHGKWVADLNLLSALGDKNFKRVVGLPSCSHVKTAKPSFPAIAIDNWEEILERPDSVCIVRAHGNSLARLAIAAIYVQKQQLTIPLPGHVCWECTAKTFKEHIKDDGPFAIFIY